MSQRTRSREYKAAYSPYGFQGAPARTGLGFHGIWYDPISGSYPLGNGHRQYNPCCRRFTSPDRYSPFGKGGMNAYAYCLGDPVNGADPSGANPLFKLFKVLATTKQYEPTSTLTANRKGYDANINLRDFLNGARNARFDFTNRQITVLLKDVFSNQHDPRSRVVIGSSGTAFIQSKRDVGKVLTTPANKNADLSVRIDHVTVLQHLSLSLSGTTVVISHITAFNAIKVQPVRRGAAAGQHFSAYDEMAQYSGLA